MRFEADNADRQLICRATWLQGHEDLVEHAHAASADEADVVRLVWAIERGCIAPAQPIADHEDNATDDLTIIDMESQAAVGKHGSTRRICASGNPISSLSATPLQGTIEPIQKINRRCAHDLAILRITRRQQRRNAQKRTVEHRRILFRKLTYGRASRLRVDRLFNRRRQDAARHRKGFSCFSSRR